MAVHSYRVSPVLLAFSFGARADNPSLSEPTLDTPRRDDWITINKDYSAQRYVDLTLINPGNVGQLKEICELQLNEPAMFNAGLLKVGRTLYVTTASQTVAFVPRHVACAGTQWTH